MVRVFALGETRIESAEGPIGGDWLEQRPGQLLKYLLCERRRVVPTDEIAEAIWPKASHLALGNVRHVIHVLRDRLEPERPKGKPSSFVVARTGGYTIDRDHVEIDVDLFERRVKSGLAAFAGNDDFAAAKELEEGLELYEADFLADEPYAEWAFAERERLRELARQGLWALAEVGKRKHDLDGAAACLQKLAEMLPFDSDVQRELLTLALRRGRRTEAMRRYNALRIRLLREFGEPPDFELSDLAGESLQSRGA